MDDKIDMCENSFNCLLCLIYTKELALIAAISPLKIILVLFVIWFLLHSNASAAIPTLDMGLVVSGDLALTARQVPYFKTTDSLFPSGSTSLEYLEKNRVEQITNIETSYRYAFKTYLKSEIKPVFPVHISQSVLNSKSKKRWSVLETKIDSILAFDTKTKQTIQFRLDEVSPDPYDRGAVLTLKDAFLKRIPQDKAATLTTVPQGQRFSVIKYINGYAEVSFKTYIGYILVTELITKFDFAKFAFANNQWHLIQRREFDSLVTAQNKKLHFNDITGIVTPAGIGLIASKNQKVPLWSRIETVKTKKSIWVQSKIKGHGAIWWKAETEADDSVYTIDELLKKEIASVSFHPTNPLKAILSAHGAYMTEDGYHWKPLKQFKNFHGPVHYFNDLMIFVGNYRSTDFGKTFENYIQIDKLASAIEIQLGFLPRRLQVKRITTLPNYQIKIELETGNRKIYLQSPLFAQNWIVTKN